MNEEQQWALDKINAILEVLVQGYGPLTVIGALVQAVCKDPRHPKLELPEWTPRKRKVGQI